MTRFNGQATVSQAGAGVVAVPQTGVSDLSYNGIMRPGVATVVSCLSADAANMLVSVTNEGVAAVGTQGTPVLPNVQVFVPLNGGRQQVNVTGTGTVRLTFGTLLE